MLGFIKKCVVVCIFSCIVCCVSNVSACLKGDGSVPQEELVQDVRYWRQGSVPYTGEQKIVNWESSSTIEYAGCSHFAMSYALVKMGYLNPDCGDTPLTHIRKAREYGAFLVDWGYYDFSRAGEMYKGITYEGRKYIEHLGKYEGLEYIKELMREGYYVIGVISSPVTEGHCIFFDSIQEDGSVVIGDSFFSGLTFDDYYGTVLTEWSYLELLKCDGKPLLEQPSIYARYAPPKESDIRATVLSPVQIALPSVLAKEEAKDQDGCLVVIK